MINKIDELSKEIVIVCEKLYQCIPAEGYTKLSQLMPSITSILSDFLHDIPTFNECGMNIPLDVIVAQIQNLMEAVENKDMIKTADCLKYEILDSMSLYKEILQEIQNG